MVYTLSYLHIFRALTPPGYIKEYHIGVRGTNNGTLYGFITATPQTVSIRGKSVRMVDVGFLSIFDPGEFPLRSQEDSKQASGSGSHPRSHSSSQPP